MEWLYNGTWEPCQHTFRDAPLTLKEHRKLWPHVEVRYIRSDASPVDSRPKTRVRTKKSGSESTPTTASQEASS
jgi:hypothetical protein